MRISLCMIVRNEEENIINCLERTLKLVDEAIIVDTGSTDKTKELLEEKYGNDAKVKILEDKWEDDFSKARNKSLEYATGDWILILDANERIFCDRGQLDVFLMNSDKAAYNIQIYNIYNKNNLVVSASMIRLFKNNNPRYKGAIHEQLEIDGQSCVGEVIDKDICKIYNLGYSPDVFQNNKNSEFEWYKDEIDENEAYEMLQLLETKDSKAEILSDIVFETFYDKALKFKNLGCRSDAALYFGLAYRYSKDENMKNKLLSICHDNETLRDIFFVAAKSKKKRFIILSSCHWENVYQRMHHIARSLAKFGHEVIYITPSVRVNVNDKNVSLYNLTKHTFNNFKIVDNVKIYTPISVWHNQERVISNYIDVIQNLLDSSTESDKKVIITYLPNQIKALKSIKGDFIHIYECVDDHLDLDYAFWGNRKDALWEQELMDSADAITTTSTALFLQRRAIEGRKNVYLSRNAVCESDFIVMTEEEIPQDLKNIPEPRIVYAGIVYKRFDEKLFYEVVDSNPDKSFIIIGPVHEGLLVEKRKNLYILGPKKHSELKRYFKYMQIGIVPYIDSADMDVACDSIKQYEYIACGLSVITTYMPESGIDKIYTYLANTKEQFNIAIEKCLGLEIDSNIVGDFLAKNTWNSRAALLCRLADQDVSEKDQLKTIDNIGQALDNLVEIYDSPIFKTLKAVYSNIEDSKIFEELAKQAYNTNKQKYIEKQYLTSLLKNGNITAFIDIVKSSPNFNNEIKQELLYCHEQNKADCVLIIACICINDIKTALVLIDSLPDEDIKSIYNIYINHILGDGLNSEEFNSIFDINLESPLASFLKEKIIQKRHSEITDHNNVYISDIFNNISTELLNTYLLKGLKFNGFCSQNNGVKNGKRVVSIKELVNMQSQSKIKIIVPYDDDYVKQVRILTENNISECYVAIPRSSGIRLIHIDNDLMSKIKAKEYNRTVTFNKFNAADSNVHALLKYMPEEYKKKYKVNIIYGTDVWSMENVVKVPLISAITVSGFASFLYKYPKLTYNIEVGHSGVPLKACGLMDREDKNSGGNREVFEKADCVCVASELHMVLRSAFYGIPVDKYRITGLPRNDTLILSNGKYNLEKLLGISLNGKKVIFNMPTFHAYDQLNRIEGSYELNDAFKIYNFDYDKFNKFLKENDLICVSKVHHGEEISVTAKTKNRRYDSVFFINNEELDRFGLDLYEIIGAGDILITDYSTIYDDFLFMNKPIIFVNTDIEEYRMKRGLALEPYDFWTAGPKVQTQEKLQVEILKYLNDSNYYKEYRERLRPVFFKYIDGKSVLRTWEVIDRAFTDLLTS